MAFASFVQQCQYDIEIKVQQFINRLQAETAGANRDTIIMAGKDIIQTLKCGVAQVTAAVRDIDKFSRRTPQRNDENDNDDERPPVSASKRKEAPPRMNGKVTSSRPKRVKQTRQSEHDDDGQIESSNEQQGDSVNDSNDNDHSISNDSDHNNHKAVDNSSNNDDFYINKEGDNDVAPLSTRKQFLDLLFLKLGVSDTLNNQVSITQFTTCHDEITRHHVDSDFAQCHPDLVSPDLLLRYPDVFECSDNTGDRIMIGPALRGLADQDALQLTFWSLKHALERLAIETAPNYEPLQTEQLNTLGEQVDKLDASLELPAAVSQFHHVETICDKGEQKALAIMGRHRRRGGLYFVKHVLHAMETLDSLQVTTGFRAWLASSDDCPPKYRRHSQRVDTPMMPDLSRADYTSREMALTNDRLRTVLYYVAHLMRNEQAPVMPSLVSQKQKLIELLWLYWLAEQAPIFETLAWPGGRSLMNRHAKRLYLLVVECRRPRGVLPQEFDAVLQQIQNSSS